MRCQYRADKECKADFIDVYIERCNVCLSGQIADNTDLLITAIANLTASIEKNYK